jgi:hypothetical protein
MRTVYSLQIDSYIRLQECCESVEGFLGQELNMLSFCVVASSLRAFKCEKIWCY